MNKLLLFLVSRLGAVWAGLGAEPRKLIQLLRAKLLADGRRKSTMNGNRESGMPPLVIDLFMVFYGVLLSLSFFAIDDFGSGLTAYLFVFLFLLAFTLITDYTEVLLDVRDSFILSPLPVSSRTLGLARLVHIGLYLFRLLFLLSLAGQIIVVIKQGWLAWPLLMLLLGLGTLLVTALVTALYVFLLKRFNIRQFREYVNYFQIGFTIILFSLYYVGTSMADFLSLDTVRWLQSGWAYVIPSSWLAGLFMALRHPFEANAQIWLLAALGLAVPLVGLYLTRRVSDTLANRLVNLRLGDNRAAADDTTEFTAALDQADATQVEGGYAARMGRFFTRPGAERAAYWFVYRMISRAGDYKKRTYPGFGFIPVFFVFILFQNDDFRVADLGQSYYYIFLLYITAYTLVTPLSNLQYSDQYEAAWIFSTHPYGKRGPWNYGTMMAIFSRFFLPIFSLISVVVVVIWGLPRVLDVAVAGGILLFCSALYSLFSSGTLFSSEYKSGGGGGTLVNLFAIMAACGVLGGLHYFIADYPLFVAAFGGLVWLLAGAAIYGMRTEKD
ncbi:MAG: hypothetical protein WBA17_03205 [Saprospiraceae bacterium]